MEYVGTRWFKCDFHVHSSISKCFKGEDKSAEGWLAKAIEEKIDCIAITDHNSPEGINSIIQAAKKNNIVIFPGVELTCDTSKIHILALFDVDKTRDDVFGFLSKCDVDCNDFGKETASSCKSIFDVIEIANRCNCILIPAHIDGFNGLGSLSHSNLEKLFDNPSILGVQVVQKDFEKLVTSDTGTGTQQIFDSVGERYSIQIDTVKKWYKAFELARKKKLAMLTFSDNPLSDFDSSHGIDGIGKEYTWIKMKSKPTLESLRQALLLPSHRIRNCWETNDNVYKQPSIWIKSIKVNKTEITSELTIDFNPQLNTIIGGRGSGKSSILQIIRGILRKTDDLDIHDTIKKEFDSFYCENNKKTKKGIFHNDSIVELILSRNNILYKVISKKIKNSEKQLIEIFEFNNETQNWDNAEEDYISLFDIDIFSQKQIYEIADKPEALINKIDKNIESIKFLKEEKLIIEKDYFQNMAKKRTILKELEKRDRLLLEKKDFEKSIRIYEKSNISTLIKTRERYIDEKEIVEKYKDDISNDKTKMIKLEEHFEDFIKHEVNKKLSEDIHDGIETVKVEYNEIVKIFETVNIHITTILEDFVESIDISKWTKDMDENFQQLEAEKTLLLEKGVDDIGNYQELLQKKRDLEFRIKELSKYDDKYKNVIVKTKEIYDKYIEILEDISRQRREFFETNIKDEKVQVKIKTFRSRESYEKILRTILKKDEGYDDEINTLLNICFRGEVKNKIDEVRKILINLRGGEQVSGYSGYFKNWVAKLSDEDIDKLNLFMPEDDINIAYKQNANSKYKSLNTASAGQKTTAILTIILSYGCNPLILDQPEDDLDNKLVYELIVDRLIKAKEKRQLIIVTHNANIPVNGDSEYIVSMDSESKDVKVYTTGCIDDTKVKKEVCDVMEGTEDAFLMRSKRYGKLN